ncbi:MAG: SRPBCC family protein [Bacteroides sp.]
MSKFESSVKVIPFSQERVYAKISDLSNLESVKDKLPEDKVKDLSFDSDSISFHVNPVGTIRLEVVERTPSKCVKFATTDSPLPFKLWAQVVPTTAEECKIKVTIDVEMNPFIAGMVKKPLMDGLEKMVSMLSMIQY